MNYLVIDTATDRSSLALFSNNDLLYSGSHELEDFGSVQTQISLRIFQMSASVGRGFACEAIVSVA